LKFENGTCPAEWLDIREAKLALKDLTHGTADCILFHPVTGKLHVIDGKFTRVDAEHGMQTRAYAAAFIEEMEGTPTPVTSVAMHVVAPRLNTPEVEEGMANVILKATRDWIVQLYARIDNPFTPPTPHVDICGNCARANTCPALNGLVVKATTGLGMPIPSTFNPEKVESLRDRAILQILAGVFENWAKQVKKSNAEFVDTSGEKIPYFKQTTRSTGLRVPKENVLILVARLGDMYGTTAEDMLGCSNVAVNGLIDAIAFKTGINALLIKDWFRSDCGDVVVEGSCSFLTKEKRMSDTDLLKQIAE